MAVSRLADGDSLSSVEGAARTASRGFGPALASITAVGLGLRVGYSVSVLSDKLGIDGPYYHQTAANIAAGRGYVAPFFGSASEIPTALHPPFFPIVMAAFDLLGLGSIGAQRIALAVVVSSGIAVMGLLGRDVAGPAVGLVTAAISAVDPFWLQPVGSLMSESILLVVIPVLLLIAVRCIDRPSPWRFVALGLAIAVAALTRSETIDFLVLLGVPVVLFAVVSWKRRIVMGLALVAGFTLLMGPWLVRNEIQMGGLTLSDNAGVTLVGTYSPQGFDPRSSSYGSFDGEEALAATGLTLKFPPPNHAKVWTELTLNNTLTGDARKFALEHLRDLPGVVVAREGLVWGLYRPGNELALARVSAGSERNGTLDYLGQFFYWVLLPFVIVGLAVLMKRSLRRLTIIAVPIVVVAINAGLFDGPTRLRVAAEPSLAVLAAIGVVVLAALVRSRPRPADRRLLAA